MMSGDELISGSQIDTWRRCQRQYHYAYDRKLAAKTGDWPRALGRAGHLILADYYSALQNGSTHEDAVRLAEQNVSFRLDVLGHNRAHVMAALTGCRYAWAKWAQDGQRWEIAGVEQTFRVARAGWSQVATVDLSVLDRATGDLVLVDHRFLYDPYTEAMARLDPQLVRYALAAGTALGVGPVRHAVRNMISTAPPHATAKAQRGQVKRVALEFTEPRFRIVEREMNASAAEILAWRQQDPALRRILARRTVIAGERYPSCSTCEFFKLCQPEAWGEDTTTIEAMEYGPSDYNLEA